MTPFDIREPFLQRAYAFAAEAHATQVRQGSGLPYIVHPLAVMRLVRDHAERPTLPQLAAALLHDTVEDTDATFDDIGSFFGPETSELVRWLTDVSKPTDGNRAARKMLDRAHSIQAPPQAQTIKVADLINNYDDIRVFKPDFALLYHFEKRLLVQGLTKADPALLTMARERLSNSPLDARQPPKSVAGLTL